MYLQVSEGLNKKGGQFDYSSYSTIIHYMNTEQEEWCHYSDLPSPLAYTILPNKQEEENIISNG
jgi:hypothetical protein